MHYVYVTIGKHFTWEAQLSAKSIKLNTTNSHTTLYTDTPPKHTKHFNKIIPIPPPTTETPEHHAKIQRITCLLNHREHHYIHLDADTYIAHDPTHIFNTPFHIASTLTTWRQTHHNYVPGVLAINHTQETQELFKNWLHDYTNSNDTKDQYHFDKHIRKTNHHQLPPELCTQVGDFCQISGKVYITHRHWENEYLNAIIPAVLINQTTDNRVWIPNEQRMISSKPWTLENGIEYTNYYITQEHRNYLKEFLKD